MIPSLLLVIDNKVVYVIFESESILNNEPRDYSVSCLFNIETYFQSAPNNCC